MLGNDAVKMETGASPLLNPTDYHLQERRRMMYAQAPSPGTSANLTVSPRDAGSSPSSPNMQAKHAHPAMPAASMASAMPAASMASVPPALSSLEQQLLQVAPTNFGLPGGNSPLSASGQSPNPGLSEDSTMDALLAGMGFIGLDTGAGAGSILPMNTDDFNALAVEPAVRGASPLASSSCPNIRDMQTLANSAYTLEQRERQRKDTHNMTEKKRRYQVNDSIQEIAELIPGTEIGARRSKGAVLKAAARHLRRLQKVDTKYREEHRKAKKYQNALHIMKQRLHEYEAVTRAHGLTVPTTTEETALLARLDLPHVSLEQCITLLDCLDVSSASETESVSSIGDSEVISDDDLDEELLDRLSRRGSAASTHSSRSNSMSREFS